MAVPLDRIVNISQHRVRGWICHFPLLSTPYSLPLLLSIMRTVMRKMTARKKGFSHSRDVFLPLTICLLLAVHLN